jgi:hypothetical protein
MITKPCKDCIAEGIATARPAPYPGPRCTTHHRVARRVRSARAHELRIEKGYGITAAEYWAIYESQDGRCYVCRRASGRTKRLAVDHDHHKEGCLHAPDVGCPNCVRCLACGPCNRELLGRYDVAALRRAITVLTDPPAQAVLFAMST